MNNLEKKSTSGPIHFKIFTFFLSLNQQKNISMCEGKIKMNQTNMLKR